MFNKHSVALLFATVASANDYLSGEVRSQERFLYGKFRTRMAAPNVKGTVTSFFTYAVEDWPHRWNELDFEIVPSVEKNPLSLNIIWQDGAQDHDYVTSFDPKDQYQEYTLEWTPDYVAWYVNDHLVRKTVNTDAVHFLQLPSQVMMNFWTPTW